jgi:hypothetical protein
VDGDQLSDLEWTESHDTVTATYGRQLATALTRGRIRRVIPDSARPESSRALPSENQIVPPLTQNDSPIVAAATPVPEESIFEVSSSLTSQDAQNRRIELVAANAIVMSNLVDAGLPPSQSQTVSTSLAKTEQVPNSAWSISGPVGTRAERLSDQVIRLITEDRLPLALQVTRCLEMRPEPSTWLPPTWLIRALVLGRHLSYSKGEIARQLDDELRSFRLETLNEGNPERQMIMSFLLRAAALPAALLSGSTTATGILRSFKIAPGFSQLYNYSSRIALYGDRLGGSLVEMFRPSGTIAGASELDDLTTTARNWLQAAARKHMPYSRTSPLFLHAHWTLTAGTAIRHAEATQLWCKWQETLLLAQRLLKPVCQGLDGERNWVRQEIARLTSQVRVEPYDAQRNAFPAASAGRGVVLPVEEMHAALLEAIGIANRWLRLCNQAGPGGASPIPLEALEMRDEILQRSDGVTNELIQQRRTATSPLVKAAIACCQSSVRQIQLLFESKLSLPVVEPDPRHVLNADLLRIPALQLNDQWSPDTDPVLFESELLAGLEQGEMSWRQCFDFHAQTGHHDATGKLLELNVWENPDEREALRATRDAQIADNRAILDADLCELAADVKLIAEAAGHSPMDRAAYLQRLEGLRRELSHTDNFNAFRRRLNQFQSTLLRWGSQNFSSIGMPIDPVARPVEPRRMEGAVYATTAIVTARRDNVPYQESIFHAADIFSGE